MSGGVAPVLPPLLFGSRDPLKVTLQKVTVRKVTVLKVTVLKVTVLKKLPISRALAIGAVCEGWPPRWCY